MNIERPDYSMFSNRQILPTKRSSSFDTRANQQERKRVKPAIVSMMIETAPRDANTAKTSNKERRIVTEKYMPVFQTEYNLDNSRCVICLNELEQLCPSCETKENQAGKASLPNLYPNVIESCEITWGKCNHVFHVHCLENWFDESNYRTKCPLDRQHFQVEKIKD